jgi:hypothetical protein
MAAQRANEAANGSGEAVYVVEKARQFASLESPIVMLRVERSGFPPGNVRAKRIDCHADLRKLYLTG